MNTRAWFATLISTITENDAVVFSEVEGVPES
jgi:hypothetical protein